MSKDARTRRKGRRGDKVGRFLMLPHDLLYSEACTTLSHAHFRALTALAATYMGENNGALTLTRPQARKHGIASNETIAAALKELERRGLVIRTDPGMRTPPRPARFAVTWKPLDKTEYTERGSASHAYRHWSLGRDRKLGFDARSPGIAMPTERARKVVNL